MIIGVHYPWSEAGRSAHYPVCSETCLDYVWAFRVLIERRLGRFDRTADSIVAEYLDACEVLHAHWQLPSICLWKSSLALLIGRCAGMMAGFWCGGHCARAAAIGACSFDACCSQQPHHFEEV